MNSKHKKTLDQVFANPVNGNIEWRKIEAMLVACGAEIIEGSGSRISVFLNGERMDFHPLIPTRKLFATELKTFVNS